MINIEELTIGDARKLASLFSAQNSNNSLPDAHWKIGKNYFIRTVTHHLTGKLASVTDKELVVTGAAWIADDGRLTDSLKSCVFNEVEIFPANEEVIIGRGSLIDAVQIKTTPDSQK
jgi:hypothetical protein